MHAGPRDFAASTAAIRTDDHSYAVDVDPAWWVGRGPNGGYLAALLLRALTATVDDPDRPPRSLTVHYAAAPGPGPASIETRLVRAGRSVVNLAARLEQDGRVMCEALAVFSRPWTGPAWHHAEAPSASQPFDPERARALGPTGPTGPTGLPGSAQQLPPVFGHWDVQPLFGLPLLAGADRAQIGGWLRLTRPRPVDAIVAAAMTDAYPPVVFTRVESRVAAPTLDLTIHFRVPLPHPTMAPEDPVLVDFRGLVCADGLFEEDGALFAPDGTLLVQSRQLAVVLPLPA